MLERLTGSAVVVIWGLFNAVMVALLAGFVLGGFGSSPFVLATYGSSVSLVFVIALAVWFGAAQAVAAGLAAACGDRQRDPLGRRRAAGLARPGSAWPSGSGSPSWRHSR